jgi:AraC-like DNA-binding protein
VLRESTVPRSIIDRFLDGPGWARFDAELGYVPRDSAVEWGARGTRVRETFDANGSRSGRFPGRRARINCYGDSFTEGTHVSDGETWEDYLAAHLGEPIGNYGVGGYGTYQAYRRLRREESTTHGAPLVIFGLSHGGIMSSTARSLWLRMSSTWRNIAAPTFHGSFRPWMAFDLERGRLVERENPLRTPASLYNMCDPEWMAEANRDDLGLQIEAFASGRIDTIDRPAVDRLAELVGVPFGWRADALSRETALLTAQHHYLAAIASLELAREFVTRHGKQLLVTLNFTSGRVEGVRQDRLLVDHLAENGFAVFDMNLIHAAEHANTRLSYDEYIAAFQLTDGPGVLRPNPRGHHAFAYAIAGRVLELLDDRPEPYRSGARAPGTDDVIPDDPLLAPLLTELHQRFAEPWTADSLARLARRSRSSLYDHFVTVMKVPPLEYIKELRLREAARLLRESDLRVADVAVRVGFVNPNHFSRAFARRYRSSPLRYRKDERRTPDR